jgi:hypothetical protein
MKPSLKHYCLAIMLAYFNLGYGQLSYAENFSTGAKGWTGGGFETTTVADCSGNGAIRARVNKNIAERRAINAVSPVLGVSDGNNLVLEYDLRLLAYDAIVPQYAVPQTDFGSIAVEASANAGGPWAVIDRIDISNHTPTDNCLRRTATLEIPLNEQLFIRFSALPGTALNSDFYIYIDEINVWQGVAAQPAGANMLASAFINPGDNYLHIKYAAPVDEWAIFNMQGQQVSVRDIDGNGSRLDISGLPYGNYMIKLRAADRIETLNIFKQ